MKVKEFVNEFVRNWSFIVIGHAETSSTPYKYSKMFRHDVEDSEPILEKYGEYLVDGIQAFVNDFNHIPYITIYCTKEYYGDGE